MSKLSFRTPLNFFSGQRLRLSVPEVQFPPTQAPCYAGAASRRPAEFERPTLLLSQHDTAFGWLILVNEANQDPIMNLRNYLNSYPEGPCGWVLALREVLAGQKSEGVLARAQKIFLASVFWVPFLWRQKWNDHRRMKKDIPKASALGGVSNPLKSRKPQCLDNIFLLHAFCPNMYNSKK